MTIKEKVSAYRKLAADRAKLAAKYAKAMDYAAASRWYNAADNFLKIAATFESPKTHRS